MGSKCSEWRWAWNAILAQAHLHPTVCFFSLQVPVFVGRAWQVGTGGGCQGDKAGHGLGDGGAAGGGVAELGGLQCEVKEVLEKRSGIQVPRGLPQRL